MSNIEKQVQDILDELNEIVDTGVINANVLDKETALKFLFEYETIKKGDENYKPLFLRVPSSPEIILDTMEYFKTHFLADVDRYFASLFAKNTENSKDFDAYLDFVSRKKSKNICQINNKEEAVANIAYSANTFAANGLVGIYVTVGYPDSKFALRKQVRLIAVYDDLENMNNARQNLKDLNLNFSIDNMSLTSQVCSVSDFVGNGYAKELFRKSLQEGDILYEKDNSLKDIKEESEKFEVSFESLPEEIIDQIKNQLIMDNLYR